MNKCITSFSSPATHSLYKTQASGQGFARVIPISKVTDLQAQQYPLKEPKGYKVQYLPQMSPCSPQSYFTGYVGSSMLTEHYNEPKKIRISGP